MFPFKHDEFGLAAFVLDEWDALYLSFACSDILSSDVPNISKKFKRHNILARIYTQVQNSYNFEPNISEFTIYGIGIGQDTLTVQPTGAVNFSKIRKDYDTYIPLMFGTCFTDIYLKKTKHGSG